MARDTKQCGTGKGNVRKWMEPGGIEWWREQIERDNRQIRDGGQTIPRGSVKHTGLWSIKYACVTHWHVHPHTSGDKKTIHPFSPFPHPNTYTQTPSGLWGGRNETLDKLGPILTVFLCFKQRQRKEAKRPNHLLISHMYDGDSGHV